MPGFDRDSARRIAAVVRRVEGASRNSTRRPRSATPNYYVKVGITTSTITARAGKTPGTGTIQPYTFNGATFVIAGDPEQIFNWTGTVVPSNVWAKYVVIDGFLFYDGYDCSGVAP